MFTYISVAQHYLMFALLPVSLHLLLLPQTFRLFQLLHLLKVLNCSKIACFSIDLLNKFE